MFVKNQNLGDKVKSGNIYRHMFVVIYTHIYTNIHNLSQKKKVKRKLSRRQQYTF